MSSSNSQEGSCSSKRINIQLLLLAGQQDLADTDRLNRIRSALLCRGVNMSLLAKAPERARRAASYSASCCVVLRRIASLNFSDCLLSNLLPATAEGHKLLVSDCCNKDAEGRCCIFQVTRNSSCLCSYSESETVVVTHNYSLILSPCTRASLAATSGFPLAYTYFPSSKQDEGTYTQQQGARLQKPSDKDLKQAPQQTCRLPHLQKTCRRQYHLHLHHPLRHVRRVQSRALSLLAAATTSTLHPPPPSTLSTPSFALDASYALQSPSPQTPEPRKTRRLLTRAWWLGGRPGWTSRTSSSRGRGLMGAVPVTISLLSSMKSSVETWRCV